MFYITKVTLKSLIHVSNSLRMLEDGGGGLQFLISTSRNHYEAKAFVLKKGRCNPNYTGNMAQLTPDLSNEIEVAALGAVKAYYGADIKQLESLLEGHSTYDTQYLPYVEKGKTLDVEICGFWGNKYTTFVDTTVTYDGKSSIGHQSFVIVLQKIGDSWKILAVSYDIDIIQTLADTVYQFSNDHAETNMTNPILINPPNEADLPRHPEKSYLEWENRGDYPLAYLIEYQYGERGKADPWFHHSFFKLVEASEATKVMKAEAPFYAGGNSIRCMVIGDFQTGV